MSSQQQQETLPHQPAEAPAERGGQLPLRSAIIASSKSGTSRATAMASRATSLADYRNGKHPRGSVSLRVLLIVFSATTVSLVVMACVIPTALLWRSSLESLSNVAQDTTDTHLATYRASVVAATTDRLQALLRSPVMVAQLLMNQLQQLPLLNHTSAQLETQFQSVFLPLYSPEFWPYIWSMQVAWFDVWGCQHQFRRVFGIQTYGIWDPCINTTMTFWYYNGSVPTKNIQTSMTLLSLVGRSWWDRPHNPALLSDEASWAPPFWSATPGEGKLVTVSYAFPDSYYNRSTLTFPITMSAFSVVGLNNYLSTIKHSANGWVLLVEGVNYNLVASSRSEFIPAKNATMPANASNYTEVSGMVNEWVAAGKPSKMTLAGDVLLDSVQVVVPGGGINFRLFLVTPRSDFLGDIDKANSLQLSHSNRTLIVVTVIEAAILLVALGASIAISVCLSRPLMAIKEQLYNVGNMELEEANAALKNSSVISEILALQVEAKRMGVALESFGKFVPRVVVKNLLKHQMAADVGVRKTKATVFFLDVVEFTKLMDTRGPVVVIEILRAMFERFSLIITSNNGVIDKYIGDSIMALWGCPEAIEQPIQSACKALNDIIDEMDDINKDLVEQYGLEMRVRIGMHFGDVYAGNVGSSERLNYTVIGGSVNLAARLEPLNKELGSVALVTDAVRNESGDRFSWRCLGAVDVRGFAEPVRIHQFVGRTDRLTPKKYAMLEGWSKIDDALRNLRAEDPIPTKMFEEYLSEHPDDQTAEKALKMLLKHRAIKDSPAQL